MIASVKVMQKKKCATKLRIIKNFIETCGLKKEEQRFKKFSRLK
jgi:hypothetical protein